MSPLQRTRSLRKPTKLPSADSSTRHIANSSSSDSISPSRLPLKPTAAARPRPLSVHGLSTTSTATTSTSGGATGSAKNTRPSSTLVGRSASLSKKPHASVTTQDPAKKESRYAPLGSARKLQSSAAGTRTTFAGSGDGSAPLHKVSPPVRGGIPVTHTRARSAVTSLPAATALQPLSRERSTSSKLAHKRSFSAGKAPSTPMGKQQKQRQSSATITTTTTTTTAAAKPRLRPAFSTLQQHYSPAKAQAPKPLTSAILAPPSPSKLPANIAAYAETSRLQAELLQLHLLHRDAHAVQSQWQASAEETLGSRFRDLCQAGARAAEREATVQEGENMLALKQWALRGAKDKNIEDRIQVLDEVVTNLWILSEPAGGRYARLVRRFERFLDRVCDAEAARRQSLQGGEEALIPAGGGSLDALFIDELDASWKDEVATLTRRLETWKAQFSAVDDFAAPDDGSPSALGRMLAGVGQLLRDMLQELYTMGEIEGLALAREEAWIERMNRGHEDEDGGTDRGIGALWRVL
ncbi:hypothetical protein E4U21_000796 [Claviceps maximensis]|nr:hypothetical protein E4U21_000796 [Claviceps maximensis]